METMVMTEMRWRRRGGRKMTKKKRKEEELSRVKQKRNR